MSSTRLATWIFAATVGLSGGVYAQEGPPPGEKPREGHRDERPERDGQPPREKRGPRAGGEHGPRLDQLRESIQSLDLTADQKESANKILDKATSDLEALRADGEQGEPRERMQRGGEVLRQMRDDLQKLLTEEQHRQLRDKMGPPPGERRFGGPGRPGGPERAQRMEEALKALNLPPDRLEKVQAVMDQTRQKMEALHEKQRATRDEMRDVMDDQRGQLSQLLTPEQHEQLRQKLGPPRDRGPSVQHDADGRPRREGPERPDHRPPPPPRDQI